MKSRNALFSRSSRDKSDALNPFMMVPTPTYDIFDAFFDIFDVFFKISQKSMSINGIDAE